MRQTDFARMRKHPSPDQSRPGSCVMYFTERPFPYKRGLFIQHPKHTIYLRNLQTFFHIRRRKDTGNTFRRHGFPASGWTDHEKIMPTCHGNLCRSFDIILPPYVCKVRKHLRLFLLSPLELFFWHWFPLKHRYRFIKTLNPDHFHTAHKGSFRHIFCGYDTTGHSCCLRFHYDRQDTRHFPHSPIKT